MARLPATGVWRLVARAQRAGFASALRGRGGGWLAVGVGAWGLQRLRSLAVRDAEVLLREPLAPGQSMVITHETLTRAEAERRAKRDRRDQRAARRERRRSRRS